jgi:hypothetical protein
MTNQMVVEATQGPDARPAITAGTDVLASLRGRSSHRPLVDPGLSGGLRDWLEDGLCSVGVRVTTPLIVSKQILRDTLAGRPNRACGGPQPITDSMALGAVMDALFRQVVTTGHIEDPMRDGIDALRVDPRRSEVVDFVHGLVGRDLAEFRDELETQAAILLSRWPRLSPAWLPRTQERIAIPLAGGDVVLVGVVDLIVGAPSTGRASVGLIEVKSGRARIEDREDLRFYGLLETLRSGAAPVRLATFYTRTGQVDAEDVDDQLLTSVVQRVLATIARMVEEP